MMENSCHKSRNLETHVRRKAPQERNETMFYQVVADHFAEIRPVIYTPTAGQAC